MVILVFLSRDLSVKLCLGSKFLIEVSFLIASISFVVCLTKSAKAGFWFNGGNLFDLILNFFCDGLDFSSSLSSLSRSSSYISFYGPLSCISRFRSRIALKSAAVRLEATSSSLLICFEYILLNSSFLANRFISFTVSKLSILLLGQ